MTKSETLVRSQLLERAAKKLGRPIKKHHVEHALRHGYVTPKSRRPDGWNLYDESSVNDLVTFMRERSRSNVSHSA